MTQPFPSCHISGERFSPRQVTAETGVLFQDAREVGEPGTVGRYQGQAQPYGSAFIRAPGDVEPWDRLLWITRILAHHLPAFRKLGVDEVVLDLTVAYKRQCNWEFSPA